MYYAQLTNSNACLLSLAVLLECLNFVCCISETVFDDLLLLKFHA